jgi:hypothetical protein
VPDGRQAGKSLLPELMTNEMKYPKAIEGRMRDVGSFSEPLVIKTS